MTVSVVLRDERRFNAHVDQRTDDEMLWLRLVRGTAAICTGFTWDLVQSVRVDSDRYTAAEFRTVAPYFASGIPESFNRKPTASAETDRAACITHAFGLPSNDGSPNMPIGVNANKVQSLSVEATLANWDRDANSDGIELRIAPCTSEGRGVAINGSLKIDLIARNYFSAHREPGFATLGQWSQPVRVADFARPSGAVYRLPFQSLPPDFDPTLQSVGLLRVHLNAFGQGDFFADATVRIRSYNPIRDQLIEHGTHHDSFGRYRARHW